MSIYTLYILYQESGGLIRYKGMNGPTTRRSEAMQYQADEAARLASEGNWMLELAMKTAAEPESPPDLNIHVSDRATGKIKAG